MAETAASGRLPLLLLPPSFSILFWNGRYQRKRVSFHRSLQARLVFEASVLLRSHSMREHAGDYSARFCCQLLVSIPGTFHIYIYIYTSPVSSAKTVSTVPTHFTYHRLPLSPVFQTFTTSRVIGRDVICIRVVATVFSTFYVYFSMYRFSFFPSFFFFFSFYLKTSKTQFG